MMSSTASIQIELDPRDKPFYTNGDTIQGRVRVAVASSLNLNDVQVKLRCEEWSTVASKRKQRQTRRQTELSDDDSDGGRLRRKPRSVQEYTKHYNKLATVFPTNAIPDVKHKCVLAKGEYSYPFAFNLPSLETYPPHCQIHTPNGLKVAVKWSLKAVIHRPEILKFNFVEIMDIPVYPLGNPISPADLNATTQLSGVIPLKSKPPTTLVDKLKDAFRDPEACNFYVTLNYPRNGIPQMKLDAPMSLRAAASGGRIPEASITRIAIYIVQCCEARARHISDLYVNKYPMTVARLAIPVTREIDLSDLIANAELSDSYPTSFATDLLKVFYKLRIEVTVENTAKSYKKTLETEVPVKLLSPVGCWYAVESNYSHNMPISGQQSRSENGQSTSGDSPRSNGHKGKYIPSQYQEDQQVNPPSYDDIAGPPKKQSSSGS